ncbi:sugar phosphate isomerase/epimerase family protein [Tatumella sp. UBA2305]|uniref:sugar phosphate isomerase/epimerase family protein n=1 Tax=Tatumella sp. UBA2305 TaxID=1947647 RepID=UPI0025EF95C2|nr:TIM barrel protein [Tatumella sp. UBA2305]
MANTRWLNTSGFSGLNDELLRLIRDSGFSQIDASPSDLSADFTESGFIIGERCSILLQRYGLHLTHLRTLENFIGAPHACRWQRREEARQRIALSLQAGCDTLLVTPPEDPDFVAALVDDDIRWLASEAARYNMKIIYQPLSSGCTDTTLAVALEHLRQLDQPNIGLMVDWLSIVAGGSDGICLDAIPVEWISGVQICDPMDIRLPQNDYSQQALNCFTDKLHSSGYQGPVGILPNPQAGPAVAQIRQAATILNALWPLSGSLKSSGQE